MTTIPAPDPATAVAPPRPTGARRGRRGRVVPSSSGRQGRALPYWLTLPGVVVLAVVAAWPLYKIIALSLQEQQSGKYALFHHGGTTRFVGLANYASVLSDATFWTVVARTAVFTAVNVVLGVGIGLALAVLLGRVSRWARLLLVGVLLFVWAIPSTVSSQVFLWMFGNQYGVVNHMLSWLPGVDFAGHDWFADPKQGLAVVTAIVVWGAVPMLAISLHAGISQISTETREAARCDGANAWQVFRFVTFPALRPLLTILTTLSVIWDFGVFNQIWFVRNGHPEPGYQTIGTYMYSVGVGASHYNTGATIGVLMMLCLLVAMAVYLRQMFTVGDAA